MKQNYVLIALFFLFAGVQKSMAQPATCVSSGMTFPTGLAVTGDYLIGSYNVGRDFYRMDLSQSNPVPQPILQGNPQTRDMLIMGNYVYAAGFSDGNVIRFDWMSPSPTAEVVATGISEAFGIARQGDIIYVSSSSGERIVRFNATDMNPVPVEVLSRPNSSILDIEIVGDVLYGVELVPPGNINRIFKLDLGVAGAMPVIVYEGSFIPHGMYIVGDFLYFSYTSDPNNPSLETVGRIDLTETNPTPVIIASGLDSPHRIVGHGSYLYVSEFQGNKISKFTDSMVPLSIATTELPTIDLYPNPATDWMCIDGMENDMAYTIYSITGKKVAEGTALATGTLSVEGLETGIYQLVLANGARQKFVKH